jgi:hypothetical protein
MSTRDRVFLLLSLLWTSFTVVSLGVITVMILREPAFPLGFSWIRTRGLAGLWITVPSALLGAAGLVLLKLRRRTGSRLLLLYSVLWALILLPGMLAEVPTIVRHPLSYCADGTCTPWVITVSITVAFAMAALVYARQAYPLMGRS